jgi:SAM-dependent methyltransferase
MSKLTTLRAQLDQTYGDFNQPRQATSAIEVDALLRDFMFERFVPYLPTTPSGNVLAIGLQNARESDLLTRYFASQTILNPAGHVLAILLQKENPTINISFTAPTNLAPEKSAENHYDAIISIHTFNFFEQPEAILTAAYKALKPQGKLFIASQNATSGSRQMAVEMGFLGSLHDIQPALKAAGQVRFFDRTALRSLVQASGFQELASGGVLLRTLTDAQLNLLINQNMVAEPYLRALNTLGLQCPDLCSSIYVVAEKG